jgi:hypothetical protein
MQVTSEIGVRLKHVVAPLAEALQGSANRMRVFVPKELHSPHFESLSKALGRTTKIVLWLFLHNTRTCFISARTMCQNARLN